MVGKARGKNLVGQKWNENKETISVRLPKDLELSVRALAVGSGDFSIIVVGALMSANLWTIKGVTTRYARLGLGQPIVVRVGTVLREKLREVAQERGFSINGLVIATLQWYVNSLDKKKSDREALVRRLLDRRGL